MSKSSELPANEVSVGHLGDANNLVMSALINQHHSLVFKICMKFLGHQQDAEDATQETFSRFAKHLDRWDRERPLEPWLARIAGNRCRSFLASRRSLRYGSARHGSGQQGSVQLQSLSDVGEPVHPETTQIDAANQLEEELSMAIATLPKMQQAAFKMFHEQGLSYAEISQQIGHPLGTVKTWVHRARQQLIQRLSDRDTIVPRSTTSGGVS